MLVMAIGLFAVMALAETNEVSRYQVIVDRAPFGQITPAGKVEAQPGFATRFKLVGMVTSNGVLQAIINDMQGNRAYFRCAGEMIEDVKVVRVESKPPQKAVIQQGLVQATLVYEDRKGGAAIPAPGPGQPPHLFTPGGTPSRRIPFQRGTQ